MFALLGLIWGSSFLWIKIALREIGPFTLVAIRLLIGMAGLAVIVYFRKPTFPIKRRTWIQLAILGVFSIAIPFVLITWSELVIDSAVTAILNGTVPLFTLILAHFFLEDERITIQRLIGLFVGFIGIVILVSRELGLGGFTSGLMGQVAVLIAAISYAGSSVFARRNLKQTSILVQAFVPIIVADLVVWTMVPLMEPSFIIPKEPLTWLALLWLGLLGTCVAYLLWYSLLHYVGPTRTTLVTYVLPVVGVALGVIFLDELLDFRLLLGVALVVSGIAVVNWRPRARSLVQQE